MNIHSFYGKVRERLDLGGHFMLLKKKFKQQEMNGVHMLNGMAELFGIKLNVRCFVVDGVLIDTGATSLDKGFKTFFKQQDIDQVVITHYHEDHTGCASFLQNEMNLPLYMHEKKLEYCKLKADYPLYRKVFWGSRPPFEAKIINPTFTSRNAVWDVIETPGHAVDHVALLNRETGQLFSGDLYVQPKTKVILQEESIPTIISSLEKLLTYDFEEVFCSHAGYLIEGRTALHNKLDYLLELQEQIIKLHKEGLTPKQITRSIFPKRYPITFFSRGEWDSLHIINSVIQG